MDQVATEEKVKPSEEQVKALKEALVKKLHENYINFIRSIDPFPAEMEGKRESFKYLATGTFWLEKAILSASADQFPALQVVKQEASASNAQPMQEPVPEPIPA